MGSEKEIFQKKKENFETEEREDVTLIFRAD